MSETLFNFLYRYRYALLGLVFGLLIYFPLFLHLDALPVRMWDEAILAMNVAAMADHHHYIVTYMRDSPDFYNCKPPLAIWCMLLSTKIFGFTELGLRLPSALAALSLCLFLLFTLRKYTGSFVYGFFTVLVLVTCHGYIHNHVTRTGEYDSILTLFSTLAAFHLFYAVEADDDRDRSGLIFRFFIFLTLAVLTKGIACMMQAPGLFVYALLRRKIVPLLKTKGFYTGLLFFIVFGVGYYPLREALNPGYLHAVWINELGGRFLEANEGHVGDFWFYFRELGESQFNLYKYVLPCALLAGFLLIEEKAKRLVAFATFTGLCFLLVISSAKTKLPHYDAPLFPYLAIAVGFFFTYLYQAVKAFMLSKGNSYAKSTLISGILLLAFLALPYREIISVVYFPKGDWWEDGLTANCVLFQKELKSKVNYAHYKWLLGNDGVTGTVGASGNIIECYKRRALECNVAFPIVSFTSLHAGDTALVFAGAYNAELNQKFEMQCVQDLRNYNAQLLYLKSEKSTAQ